MAVKIKLLGDTLNEATARFAPDPIAAPIFINALQKSGTHLLRNILRMFVPVDQQYHAAFIQWPRRGLEKPFFQRYASSSRKAVRSSAGMTDSPASQSLPLARKNG